MEREKCIPWNNKRGLCRDGAIVETRTWQWQGLIKIPDPPLPTMPMFSLSLLIKQGCWLCGHKTADKAPHSITLPCCYTPWLQSACGNARAGERMPFVSQPQSSALFDQRFGEVLWGAFGRFSSYLFIHGVNWILGNTSSGECVRIKSGAASKEKSSVVSAFSLKEERNGEKQKWKKSR